MQKRIVLYVFCLLAPLLFVLSCGEAKNTKRNQLNSGGETAALMQIPTMPPELDYLARTKSNNMQDSSGSEERSFIGEWGLGGNCDAVWWDNEKGTPIRKARLIISAFSRKGERLAVEMIYGIGDSSNGSDLGGWFMPSAWIVHVDGQKRITMKTRSGMPITFYLSGPDILTGSQKNGRFTIRMARIR